MFNVVSKYAGTDIVFANAHGPYAVDGGSPVTLGAGAPNPHATYAWDLGDGATAATASVTHVYGRHGVYVARVAVTVNEPGGDTSRHYAQIRVRNVPPVVSAGPDRTVNEGEVVNVDGSFTDVQWLETHTATWDWGDEQSPSAGTVVETHDEPLGKGTVGGTHAWGDAGTYTITLRVQDEGGATGFGKARVTVLNMPPVVDALAPLYAYPCCVLTLRAHFTDPGWLDTHAAFWDFGDCSGPRRAVVDETHKAPAGQGTATASHVYHHCGTYRATCTVIDDDGAPGTMATVVTVVDVRNAGFEEGFCRHQLGEVGNAWSPYLARIPTLLSSADLTPLAVPVAPNVDIFTAEHATVRHGGRAQRIRFLGNTRAGVMQRIGANPGWDYQVTVWYSLNEQAGGDSVLLDDVDELIDQPPELRGAKARLGIDPDGGLDPSSSGIVWMDGMLRPEWSQLCVRATAGGEGITVFIEGQGGVRLGADVCFDDAALVAVQPFCPPAPPQQTCVDFASFEKDAVLPPEFEHEGFRFTARDGEPQRIVQSTVPPGPHVLEIRPRGLEVTFPVTADMARATLVGQGAVILVAYDADRNEVARRTVAPGGPRQTVEVSGRDMTVLDIVGRSGIQLEKLCVHPQEPADASPTSAPTSA
jgi:PKD repeat protein